MPSPADVTPSPLGLFGAGFRALRFVQSLSTPSAVDYSKLSQRTRDILASIIVSAATGTRRTVSGSRPGPNPRNLVVPRIGAAAPGPTSGPSPADRYVPGTAPSDARLRLYRQLAKRSQLLAVGYNIWSQLLTRAARAKLKTARRIRGARGVRWIFRNGRWWQIGRGVLRGGAASAILTGVLNLPNPTPTQPPRVRVRDVSGRYGPWRYQDPRTGKYTARAPGSGGGGATAARGRAAAPTALPGGASSSASSSRTSGGVLQEVRVTARRVPVPVPTRAPTRLQQLLKIAPALIPLVLPSRGKDRARAFATVTGVGQPVSQVVPQAYPFPLTAVERRGVASNECPPGCRPEPKKRKPRKRREVCYQGTYTETASGLRKTKRRKVPCR